MQAWLPKAEEARSDSGCAVTLGYSEAFSQALGVRKSRGPNSPPFRDHPTSLEGEGGSKGTFWGFGD